MKSQLRILILQRERQRTAKMALVTIINSRELSQLGAVSSHCLFGWGVADFREAIDLGNLVPQLDQTASGIVENQKDALVQRKELAQKTKDFRKLEESEKLSEWKVLLKGKASGLLLTSKLTVSQRTRTLWTYSQIMARQLRRRSYKCTPPFQKLPTRIRCWRPPWSRF